MRKIAVINQNSASGKTTAAVNLGHALALKNKKVLLIDLDPHGNLSACLGLFRAPHEGIDSVLLNGDSLQSKKIATRELLELIPAGNRLDQFEHISGGVERGELLRSAINRFSSEFDYVIFDCPPTAGLLVMNALLAADDVMLPVYGDDATLAGLNKLMELINRVEVLRENSLKRWIFFSRYFSRRKESKEAMEKIYQHFPRYLLRTSVSESVVLAECGCAGRSIFEYRPKSQSACEFATLADDLLYKRVLRDEWEKKTYVA